MSDARRSPTLTIIGIFPSLHAGIIANSWGTSWGLAGYGRIKAGTNEAGSEEEATYALAELPAACATTPLCANGGEFDAACKCQCPTSTMWSGPQCDVCAATCLNGGQARTAPRCSSLMRNRKNEAARPLLGRFATVTH